MRTFIAALFITDPKWGNKQIVVYFSVEYNVAMKKKNLFLHSTTWMKDARYKSGC